MGISDRTSAMSTAVLIIFVIDHCHVTFKCTPPHGPLVTTMKIALSQRVDIACRAQISFPGGCETWQEGTFLRSVLLPRHPPPPLMRRMQKMETVYVDDVEEDIGNMAGQHLHDEDANLWC